MKIRTISCITFLLLLALQFPLYAEDKGPEAAVSPKKPWGDFTVYEEKEESPWWRAVLLWIPNRVLDVVDIFRLDAGVGLSYGAVARISRYGQVGYRSMSPWSVRVGDFGRTAPVLLERSNEFGIGPGYVESKDRKVCPGEVGVGADVVLIGAYGGVCVEELLDFAAGLFFLDILGDDLR